MRRFAIGATAVGLLLALCFPLSGAAAPTSVSAVDLPLTAFGAIAVDPLTGVVYVSSGVDNAVVRVTPDGAVRRLDGLPRAAGLAVAGSTLYVALPGQHAVAAVDTATFTERARLATGADTCPTHLAGGGATVWFGYGCGRSFGTAGLGRIDDDTVRTGLHGDLSLLDAPLVDARPGGPVAISENTHTNLQVHVFDVDGTGARLRLSNDPGALGDDTVQFSITSDRSRLVLATGTPGYIQVLNLTELKLVGVHDAEPRANSVAASPDGQRVAATVADGSTLLVYATGRATPRERIALADTPGRRGLAWSPDSRRIYTVTGGGNPVKIRLTAVDVEPASVPVRTRPAVRPLTPSPTGTGHRPTPPAGPASP